MPSSAAGFFFPLLFLFNILIFHERNKLVFTDLVGIFLELIALSGHTNTGRFTNGG